MMKKKVINALLATALLLAMIGAVVLVVLSRQHNLLMKLTAQQITEDQTVEGAFYIDVVVPDDGRENGFSKDRIPVYKFTPSESDMYSISITDIQSDDPVNIWMSAMNSDFEDYASADNHEKKTKAITDNCTAEASLQAGQECYIMIDAIPEEISGRRCSGSFKLTVTKAPEEKKLPEAAVGESVTVKVGREVQSAAVFNPPVTGYYRFNTSIDPKLKSTGYSMISSVTTQGKQTIGVTDGICFLEEGKEYFVWVSVYETNRKTTDVFLSCSSLDRVTAGGKGKVHITGDTVIEYRPEKKGNIAVYSMSEGDPKAIIYETESFPLRTEDDTEISLSHNPDDFAVAFTAGPDNLYRICVYGDPGECDIVITDYIGDGSTLTQADVAPLPEEVTAEEQAAEEDAAENKPQEGEAETNEPADEDAAKEE